MMTEDNHESHAGGAGGENDFGHLFEQSMRAVRPGEIVKGRVVHCSISDVEQEGVVYRSGFEFIESSDRVYGVIAGFIDAVRAGRRAV